MGLVIIHILYFITTRTGLAFKGLINSSQLFVHLVPILWSQLFCLSYSVPEFTQFDFSYVAENCNTNPDICSADADCVDMSGTFECVCMDGFTGNGMNCTGTPMFGQN